MMHPLPARHASRAVSSMFRLFGGEGRELRTGPGQGGVVARVPAMHAGEARFFAIAFPLTILVAVWHGLDGMFGGWLPWALCVPVALVFCHVLPFVLAGRSPRVQWHLWWLAAVLWAWFHRDASPVVASVAWGWLAITALNVFAACVLTLRASMRWSGRAGVAWRVWVFFAAHVVAIWAGWQFGVLYGVVVGTGIAAVYCLAVLRPNCGWLGEVIRHHGGRPFLTFDDGPHPQSTLALLDALDARGEKAMFFLIGENARRHPEIAREIVRRGHEIGNHTQTHPQATFWCAGPWRTAREIRECQRVLREITGVTPRYFRAPVGHRNFFTHPIAAAAGLRVVGWSRRGYDADARVPAARVIERIAPGLRHGDIILLHDARLDAAEIARAVLDAAAERGS